MPSRLFNSHPDHGIRVPCEVTEAYVRALFLAVGMSEEHAQHMAVTLTANDLRCVFSHGTRQVRSYISEMKNGHTNPQPNVTVVSESEATAILDGDGGLGYFPSHWGTEMAIEKALKVGVSTVITRNHFHFGAAGNYSRMALASDCIGMALSSHRYHPRPEATVMSASGGSPISIAVPAGEQPPLVMDMAANFIPYDNASFAKFPAAIFKGLGLAAVLQAMGGILAGIWNEGYEFTGEGKGAAPHQGAFIAVFDVKRFADVETFKQEMDRYIGEARATKPLPGHDRAELAGGMEWQWEKEHREIGIPMADEHLDLLQQVGDSIGVSSPFGQFEGSRF